MALGERATGTGGAFSSPATITLTAAPVAGDLILVFVDFNNDTSGVHPTPAISGFTSLGASTASVWSRLTLFGKIAAGTEGTSLTLTWTSVGAAAAGALVISGADSALPTNIITTPDGSSDTTASIPAITTAAANSWDVAAVCFGGNNDYASSGTNYSAWGSSLVEKIDYATGSGGFDYAGLGVAYVARASAGVQAATSVTQSTADVSGAIRVEVKEAAGGGGGVTVNLSGSPNSVALTTVDPTTILGSLTLNLTASPNTVVLATVNPTVILGSISLDLSASPASLALTSVNPTTILGSLTLDLTAAPNSLALTTVDPTVTAGGGTTIDLSGAPNAMTLTTVAPTVVLGSVSVDLAAAANSLALATVDPTVINNVTLDLSAAPALLTLTTVNPTVVAGGDISLDLSASPAQLALTTMDPTVVLGSTTANLIAAPNLLALTTVDPTVTIADAFALPLSTRTLMIRPVAVSAPRRPAAATNKAATPGAATTLV